MFAPSRSSGESGRQERRLLVVRCCGFSIAGRSRALRPHLKIATRCMPQAVGAAGGVHTPRSRLPSAALSCRSLSRLLRQQEAIGKPS